MPCRGKRIEKPDQSSQSVILQLHRVDYPDGANGANGASLDQSFDQSKKTGRSSTSLASSLAHHNGAMKEQSSSCIRK
jgi:hypothetical protein